MLREDYAHPLRSTAEAGAFAQGLSSSRHAAEAAVGGGGEHPPPDRRRRKHSSGRDVQTSQGADAACQQHTGARARHGCDSGRDASPRQIVHDLAGTVRGECSFVEPALWRPTAAVARRLRASSRPDSLLPTGERVLPAQDELPGDSEGGKGAVSLDAPVIHRALSLRLVL